MVLDPVTLAILKGRLEQIADEMDATLFRSAFNPIIAEAHDASHGIYDAGTGDTLVQGKSGLPIFVGVMAFGVKAVIDKAAAQGGPRDGDVWIFNEPYDGGTHLSDMRLVRPYFRDGRVFCWLASVGHWHDVGGNVPGNYNPAATECFQEGVLIPPVKLFDRGELRQDVVDILMSNSRLPGSAYGDLNGQINALDLGMKRLDALLADYGDATVAGGLAELKARAAQLMRAEIAALPDGTVSAEDWLDNDGSVDRPLKVALDLTITGDRMVMDFSRSAPACRGPVNISRSTTIAACYVALKHVFGDVPANAGVLEPIEFVIDEGSILAARAPKPVGGYTETILRLIDLVFQTVAQIAPERSNGCAYGTINALSIAGHRSDGRRWVMFSFFGGGHGGHPVGDGLNHGNAPISTATIPPLEILEAAYPVKFTQWALRPDSGGPGRHRGGLGAVYEIELLEEEATAFLFGDRGRFPPRGVAGGGDAAMTRFTYPSGGQPAHPPLASKIVDVPLRRGDRLRLETPGGGGYGDPAARDADAVRRDIALGFVGEDAARRDYELDGGGTRMSRYVVGVDVGGTFTDVFVWDEAGQVVTTAKVPSTRGDQSRGFVEGIRSRVGDFAELATVVHGTTVGTNALLERKGARTGIITTAGFRDVLEMRRRDRPRTWGLWGTFEPVVPRDLRREVRERVLADGTIEEAVTLDEVEAEARALIEAGCQSVCVFFINGYANAGNERQAVEAVRSLWPNAYVTAATEIIPEIREFERLSTATLNAYLQPVVSAYLDRLERALAEGGFGGDVLIVQSNGGVMTVETAKRFPVRTALSGPAAGVIAARAIARAAGFDNVITCDMGGTSFDVSLIADGEAALAAQTAIGFGMVVRTPMIEITTIGAGGGSVAGVDAGGILQVGPESAGSDPGPACYGLGNDRPTVTDANLVLGRINPDRPIGSLGRLDVDAARAAVQAHVGAPLGLSVEDAAEAILKVANAKMAGAIRLVSIERGHDPARFAAMPFGGGGALHTGALMREVGLGSAIVPRFPGVTSALGCVVADMRHDRVQTVNRLLSELGCDALEAEMRGVADETEGLLARAGVGFERIDRQFEFDMLYLGQTHTVAVPLPMEGRLTREGVQAAFDTAYRAAYGRLLAGIPVRVLNYRIAVTGRRPHFDMQVFAPPEGRVEDCRRGERRVRVDGADLTAPVYERLDLPQGAEIPGPAILEQPDTTIFIDPGLAGRVDAFGNLIIARTDDATL